MSKYQKRSKIVATLGPSTESQERIKQLIEAGMDVARLNFAYGEYDFHAKVIDRVRKMSEEVDRPIGILQDVRGVNEGKQMDDIKFGMEHDIDYLALSYVQNAGDIEKIREITHEKKPYIIAKIETPEAVKNFDSILEASDGVMVARGDLGIELPPEEVPVVQKQIIEKCLRAAKPVIVATEMLLSMTRSPRPTRAEVSDVANAVVDHADALMLSEETSTGKYPVEAVQMMNAIISETETSPYDDLPSGYLGDDWDSVSSAVASAAHDLAKNIDAKAILAATSSGFSARMIARHRPDMPIVVVTNKVKVYRELSLLWGVKAYMLPYIDSVEELIGESVKAAKLKKIVKSGDRVVIATGQPVGLSENMNLVEVKMVD